MTGHRIRRPVVLAAGANSNPAGNPDVRELAYAVGDASTDAPTPPGGLRPCLGDGVHAWLESELRVLADTATGEHRVPVAWRCPACATAWRLAPEVDR